MLFSDAEKFEKLVPEFIIRRNELTECLVFPLSGGVIAKSPTVNLPEKILRRIDWLDHKLIQLFPSVFAMGRRVVLERR